MSFLDRLQNEDFNMSFLKFWEWRDEWERKKRIEHRPRHEPLQPELVKEANMLRTYITRGRRDSAWRSIKLTMLMFGPSGHGKSSFCNGCRSALRASPIPATFCQVGTGAQGSFTKGFHAAQYGDHWMIDMPGVVESSSITSTNIKNILLGRIPFSAEIDEHMSLMEGSARPGPVVNPVSCVIIVLRYDADIGPELKRQLGVILELAGRGELSYILVLTCLSECDPQFKMKENAAYVHSSSKVQAAVKRMSGETGIPPYAISFVNNYTTETETDINTSLLHLRALERAIDSSIDQIEKGLDRRRHKQMSSGNTLLISCVAVIVVAGIFMYFYQPILPLLK